MCSRHWIKSEKLKNKFRSLAGLSAAGLLIGLRFFIFKILKDLMRKNHEKMQENFQKRVENSK